MARTIIISLAAALCFCSLVYGTTQYNIEELKQNSFMMKACADAGGVFGFAWGRPKCERPTTQSR